MEKWRADQHLTYSLPVLNRVGQRVDHALINTFPFRGRFQGDFIRQFVITVDRDEDGVWITECPLIPGCVSQGQTKDEAIANIQEAIQLCLEVQAAQK